MVSIPSIVLTKNFIYLFCFIETMKPKKSDNKHDEFWKKLEEWQQDSKFREAIAEFVKLTTS